jgi:predicted component of type VI protein secretion system
MGGALERITLHHVEGSRSGQTDSYSQPSIVVGRAGDCHLIFGADKGVSGHHCEIRQADGKFVVVDTNSTNGTLVNEERVTEHELVPGDMIRFGYMGPVVRVEFEQARAVAPTMPPPARAAGTVFLPSDALPPVARPQGPKIIAAPAAPPQAPVADASREPPATRVPSVPPTAPATPPARAPAVVANPAPRVLPKPSVGVQAPSRGKYIAIALMLAFSLALIMALGWWIAIQ